MRVALCLASALGVVALGFVACTNDYSNFEFKDTGGSSGTGGKGGSGGTKAGGGSGGSGGSGATGGINVGGTGGVVGGGGGVTGGTGGIVSGGGTGGTVAGGGTAGAGGSSCGAGTKLCNGSCVPDNQVQTGCAGPSCDPCNLANATPQCYLGQCALLSCNTGFDNCDKNASNGCEQQLNTTQACGACDHACTTINASAATCTNGSCEHTCNAGFGDCVKSITGPDNGCETDFSNNQQRCGSCTNNCAAQSGFSCANSLCGCTSATQCTNNGTCDGSGLCHCGGSTCAHGEYCKKSGPSTLCSCNGGSPCASGQTCCQNPAGCKNLQTDPANCGACGNACAGGASCIAGVCGGGTPDAGATDAASD